MVVNVLNVEGASEILTSLSVTERQLSLPQRGSDRPKLQPVSSRQNWDLQSQARLSAFINSLDLHSPAFSFPSKGGFNPEPFCLFI